MSFGKLYGFAQNPRTIPILVVAKANGLDLELVHTEPNQSADYLKVNSLGKIPTFVGANGFVLNEAIAIAVYVTSQNEKTTLLGKTKQDYASILRWMSFGNSEVLPKFGGWYRPLIGADPYNKKAVEDSSKAALKAVGVLEEHLTANTFLVGERLTLADIFVAGLCSRAFTLLLGKKWRSENPAFSRWYETIVNQPLYKEVVAEPTFADEGLKNVQPKKEEAPKAAKPKAAAEEEEKPAPTPKPKHPLEALPKPTLILDDWKRKYSNEDTRSAALPWFWENFKPDEYSLWKVDYKYNDELTMTFMSNNLIGGFFARLEASRKYIFGAASVFGEMGDSFIQGAFMIRGQEATPAFDVAPDWESYSFTKLDHTKEEDRKFVEDQWAQDVAVVKNGKEYECTDGKVFK